PKRSPTSRFAIWTVSAYLKTTPVIAALVIVFSLAALLTYGAIAANNDSFRPPVIVPLLKLEQALPGLNLFGVTKRLIGDRDREILAAKSIELHADPASLVNAVRINNAELAGLVLAAGVDARTEIIDPQTNESILLLLYAIKIGASPSLVHTLLLHNADLRTETAVTKDTAFTLALRQPGDALALTRTLLDAVDSNPRLADVVNKPDHQGITPLLYAIARRAPDSIPLMIQLLRYSTLAIRDHAGKTALVYAVESGNTEKMKTLLENNGLTITGIRYNGKTPLHLAMQRGDQEMAELMLNFGMSLDERADDQATALMFAVESGKSELVEMIVQKAPELIPAKRKDGKTAAQLAAELNFPKASAILKNSAQEQQSNVYHRDF
ncbi:MAG TPA: ankyrin repeat domain-containing protein, partial [Oligoflexia bacterium]|nr:ankyrin repeat domain-containing protein [Oligoflexia bacterium]